ncbi:MAG: CinA family protein [Gammaproteobacteria bacterium]|nr:CinA family protein [Gammaproteobacteria bacterium]
MSLEPCKLAKKTALTLRKKKLTLAVAESCTGGLLAATITAISGSSTYFERGFVVYSNIAKQEILGVKTTTLKKYGAVSEKVAKEMALGTLKHSHADISIAITGIAGPTGASKNKPIGTVCFALSYLELPIKTVTMHFKGQRNLVRTQAVTFALKMLLQTLESLN